MATEFDLRHDRCCSKVCVVCYEKASRILSDLEIETVDKFLIDGQKSTHPDFPCGIFSIALPKKRKDVNFEIPVLESYDLERKVGLHSVGACLCRICTVAKRNGLSVLQLSRKKDKRGRQTSKPVTTSHIKNCSNCFSTIAEGSNDTVVQCKNSKRTKVENLVNISSPSTLQRAASRDRKTSDCPFTPLGRPKKKRKQ